MSASLSSHVFGPVPSRRLGRSLGVDVIPFKTCTFDCIYCQLGRTTHHGAVREAHVNPEAVVEEVAVHLRESTRPDIITLSGSGEPTLCLGLDRIIAGIKQITDIPVGVLTNSSLLWDREVRSELLLADLVIPSLDAGDAKLFQHINRPCSGIDFDCMVEALCKFRQEFSGKLWLEVFFLAGFNSVIADATRIAEHVRNIAPDRVQLNTVARPPAEEHAKAVSPEQMMNLAKLLDGAVEIIAASSDIYQEDAVNTRCEDVLSLISRRPCTVGDIAVGLGIHRNEVLKFVGQLVQEGQIEQCSRNGVIHYIMHRKAST